MSKIICNFPYHGATPLVIKELNINAPDTHGICSVCATAMLKEHKNSNKKDNKQDLPFLSKGSKLAA